MLVALERAGNAALRRRLVRLPLPLAAVTACVAMAQSLLLVRRGAQPSLIHFLAPAALMALGAGTTIVLSWYALRHLNRHAYGIWANASLGNEQGIVSCWTSATSLLIFAEVFGALWVFGLYHVTEWLLLGVGFLSSTVEHSVSSASSTAARWTAYFGIGTTVTALWLQHMGSVFLGAANLGPQSVFRQRTGLDPKDPRNPAILIDPIARQLGEALPRVLDAFATSAVVATLTFLLLHPAVKSEGHHIVSQVAAFPVLLRGFGLLAAFFGLITLRSSEQERLERAVFRGQLVAESIALGAVVGAIAWLCGTWSAVIALAVLVGTVLPSLVAHLRLLGLARLSRDVKHQSSYDEYTARLERLGRVLERVVLLPAVAYAAVLFFAASTSSAVQPHWWLVAAIVALGSPSALSSWRGAASLAADIHTTALLAGTLGRLPLSSDSQLRHQRLRDSLTRVAHLTEPVRVDGGAMLCALAAIVIGWSSRTPPAYLAPMTVAVALLALLPCLLAFADSLRRGARSAQGQSAEICRQLRARLSEGSEVQLPPDFVPSYRSCVELLAREAATGGLVPVTLAVALPLLIASVSVGAENSTGPQATLLAMYVSVAVAAGIAFLHAGQAGVLASSLASRNHRTGAPERADSKSDPFELVEFLQRTIAVSVPLFVKATTLAALTCIALVV